MKKIGILGGTFNPIHNAHIAIAYAAKDQLSLDEVWFMPAGTPPHKQMDIEVSAKDRIEMVRLAIAPFKGFVLCDIEADKKEPCYTYETLKKIKHDHKEDSLYFIIGGDSFLQFSSWVKPNKICSYADIVVARRSAPSDMDDQTFSQLKEKYESSYKAKFYELEWNWMDISSTDIRNRLCQGLDVVDLVPEPVMDYIQKNQLYTDQRINFINQIQEDLKQELKPSRYEHTLGVMHTAANLAFAHGYDYKNAMLAGLLHDCAKNIPNDEKISLCEKNNIPITHIEYNQPQLLHGKLGAYLARTKYEILDEEILHSIEVHTTGCANMSTLDLIIYIADYIEPRRDKAPRLEEVRRMAYVDLLECAYMILEDTYHYLIDSDKEMDPITLESYLYYKNLLHKE